MWAGVVIEGYEAGYTLHCILIRLEAPLTVDDLGLQYAVHTLCYGVVRRLVVLRHAYSYAILLQFIRIGIAAILHAPVRVMDESSQFFGRCLRDGHPESLQRVFRLQGDKVPGSLSLFSSQKFGEFKRIAYICKLIIEYLFLNPLKT